jgi:hypothetical protein
MSTRYTQEPSQIDYHADAQARRVERARTLIDPGDVLSVIDSRIAAEPDPARHPLYGLVLFYLDRVHAVDGGLLYDQFKALVLSAIDTCVDDLLQMED